MMLYRELPLINKDEEKIFIDDYYKLMKPVVIRGGAKNWPAMQLWDFEYLSSVAGEYVVTVKPKADYKNGKSMREIEATKEVLLKDALKAIFETGSPNLSYIRESNLLSRCKELASDVICPSFMESTKPHAIAKTGSNDPKIWIGPENTVAQLHWDPEHNFYVQVKGRKKVIVLSPSELNRVYPNAFSIKELSKKSFFKKNKTLLLKLTSCADNINITESEKFKSELVRCLNQDDISLLCDFLLDFNNCHVHAELPDLISHQHYSKVNGFEAVLEPGDLLFIPYFWYHYFRSLEPSISVNWFFLPESLSKSICSGWPRDILFSHLIP